MQTIDLTPVKGVDKLEIEGGSDFYCVREHRKNKESGVVVTTEHLIPYSNVEVLRGLIRKHCVPGEVYGYKFLVRMLLEHYKFHETEGQSIEQFMDSFSGGRNRAKYYFVYYYFVMKVLEFEGFIQYLGRGGCIRLQK